MRHGVSQLRSAIVLPFTLARPQPAVAADAPPFPAAKALTAAVPGRRLVAIRANGLDTGRELFAGMRRNALPAEEGACTWL